MSTSAKQFETIFARGRAQHVHDSFVRRRTGKIARLPVEIRTWVNRAILDGTPYQDIRTELERSGYPDISDGCLTSWFQGGYQDWLRSQDQIEQCKTLSEHAIGLTRELKNDIHNIADLNETLVAAHLTQCLYAFDPNDPRSIDDFLRIARTVNQQARERSIRHRALLATRIYNDELAATPHRPGQAPTPLALQDKCADTTDQPSPGEIGFENKV